MEKITTVKLDLGIDAQRIASQVMIHNKSIEEQLIKGIEQAIAEISDEKGFVEYVKNGTKEVIREAIKNATENWQFKDKITKAITGKLDERIKEYADGVADKVLKDL